MRNTIITVMSNIAAAIVGWGPRAAKGLALTQRMEPLYTVPSNLWAWTHDDEWDEFYVGLIADNPKGMGF